MKMFLEKSNNSYAKTFGSLINLVACMKTKILPQNEQDRYVNLSLFVAVFAGLRDPPSRKNNNLSN